MYFPLRNFACEFLLMLNALRHDHYSNCVPPAPEMKILHLKMDIPLEPLRCEYPASLAKTSAAKLLFFQHIKYCNHGLFSYKVANEYSSFIYFFQLSIHASPFSFLLSLYVFFTLVDFLLTLFKKCIK